MKTEMNLSFIVSFQIILKLPHNNNQAPIVSFTIRNHNANFYLHDMYIVCKLKLASVTTYK